MTWTDNRLSTQYSSAHAPLDSETASTDHGKPSLLRFTSTPSYQSPLRHHQRHHSSPRHVKETLNARSQYSSSQDDGTIERRINQYVIGKEIGSGSFGAVHLAKDQFGQEYAVKEFSKSRLRKRAKSQLLRRPQTRQSSAQSNGSSSRPDQLTACRTRCTDSENPLHLIHEEIAIMKKLNHNNLVQLVEVLDNPDEDSLYMVLELCKKGVVMKIGINEPADPYDEDLCRLWFRDLILGIEYLHAQGIIHRDIKPDNLLLTEDDVLKIVDFGVSEMFEKKATMLTAKSAGSPAFLPPELCVAQHGDVDGRAADIWSMGITLYCLKFGKIPFERDGPLQLYEAVRTEEASIPNDTGPALSDLFQCLLEKNPSTRITMDQLRKHPWVTMNGSDPLLSAEENTADIVGPPTDAEMNSAITSSITHLLTVARAVANFKRLLFRKNIARALIKEDDSSEMSQQRKARIIAEAPAYQPKPLRLTKSYNIHGRTAREAELVLGGVHRDIEIGEDSYCDPSTDDAGNLSPKSAHNDGADRDTPDNSCRTRSGGLSAREHWPDETPNQVMALRESIDSHGKGHAHDLTIDSLLYLSIGAGSDASDGNNRCVSESPAPTDEDLYGKAYKEEVERITHHSMGFTKVFSTRHIDEAGRTNL